MVCPGLPCVNSEAFGQGLLHAEIWLAQTTAAWIALNIKGALWHPETLDQVGDNSEERLCLVQLGLGFVGMCRAPKVSGHALKLTRG